MWILIFYAITTNGLTSFSQEFRSQIACEQARDFLANRPGVVFVGCIEDDVNKQIAEPK